MPRDGIMSERLIIAANLRRRAGRVRRLMGGMVEKANYDRLLEYAVGLEIRATELERGDQ